jgi:hypothetical protein
MAVYLMMMAAQGSRVTQAGTQAGMSELRLRVNDSDSDHHDSKCHGHGHRAVQVYIIHAISFHAILTSSSIQVPWQASTVSVTRDHDIQSHGLCPSPVPAGRVLRLLLVVIGLNQTHGHLRSLSFGQSLASSRFGLAGGCPSHGQVPGPATAAGAPSPPPECTVAGALAGHRDWAVTAEASSRPQVRSTCPDFPKTSADGEWIGTGRQAVIQ